MPRKTKKILVNGKLVKDFSKNIIVWNEEPEIEKIRTTEETENWLKEFRADIGYEGPEDAINAVELETVCMMRKYIKDIV